MLHSQKKKKNESSRNSRASGEITIDLELYSVPENINLTLKTNKSYPKDRGPGQSGKKKKQKLSILERKSETVCAHNIIYRIS